MIGTGEYWEEEGGRFSDDLKDLHSVIIAGADPESSSHVAIGIGREHSRERKVVLVDLGEGGPIKSLVKGDDVPGLSDYVSYGVAASKVVYRTDVNLNLFAIPAGAEAPSLEELPANARWRALIDGFRAENALVVLVSTLDVAGVGLVARTTDGIIGVGGLARAKIGDRNMLAHVESPSRSLEGKRPPIQEESTGPKFGRSSQKVRAIRDSAAPAVAGARGGRTRTPPAPKTALPPPTGPAWFKTPHFIGGALAITVLVAALAYAIAPKPAPVATADTTTTTVETVAPSLPPPLPTVDTTATGDTLPVLVATNPADSASATTWCIQLLEANTLDGATGEADQLPRSIPLKIIAPVFLGTSAGEWYRVMLGAYVEKQGADSLYNALQGQDVLPPGAQVVQAPYAFLIKSQVPDRQLGALLKVYSKKNIAVYALSQGRRSNVYAGSFATAKDAGLLAVQLQQAGVEPVLVYRTGRP